jgi:hypothetical protein
MSDSLIHSRETVRCAPDVEEEISSRSAGILRPYPDDACAAEGDLLSPRARPRARGRVFALPQRCSAPSHHSELQQPTSVMLPKASKPPVVRPLPWPSVLAPVCVIAQPLSRRRQWASTKWAPETLHRRLSVALIPHQPWRRAAPAPPQPLAPGYATLHASLMQVSSSRPPALDLSRPPMQSYPFPWP